MTLKAAVRLFNALEQQPAAGGAESRGPGPRLCEARVASPERTRESECAAAIGAAAGRRPAVLDRASSRRSACSALRAYLMIECLVYIGAVAVLLGIGYAAMYRCIENSVALRRNADDIVSALHAGELWRADVRSATGPVHLENHPDEQVLQLQSATREVAYRFSTNTVFRRIGVGPWAPLLQNVKASEMVSDPRQQVTPWRWELELRSRVKARPTRLRPLFTFIAVPETNPAK